MSIYFSLEALEGRRLLSCLPEPAFDGDIGAWVAYSEGVSAVTTRYFETKQLADWYQAANEHYGLVDVPPSQGHLDALLAKKVGVFPRQPEVSEVLDFVPDGSWYDFSMVTLVESGPKNDRGLHITLDVVIQNWYGERLSYSYSDEDEEVTVHVQSVERMSLQATLGLSSRDGGTTYFYDLRTDEDIQAFNYRGFSDYQVSPGGHHGSEVYLDLGLVEFRNGSAGIEFWPTRGNQGVIEQLVPGHDHWQGGVWLDSGEEGFNHAILLCDGPAADASLDAISVRGRSGDSDGDGLIDWAGRYVGGVQHDERIEVTFADAQPRAVRFELVSDEHSQVVIDTDGSDGWSFAPAIHELSRDAVVEIRVDSDSANPIQHTILLEVDAPGFVEDYAGSWDPATGAYQFVKEDSWFGEDGEFRFDIGEALRSDIEPEVAELLDIDQWQLGLDVARRQSIAVSMDPEVDPRVTGLAVTPRVTGFGQETVAEATHEAEPVREGTLAFSVTMAHPKLQWKQFSFTIALAFEQKWSLSRVILTESGLLKRVIDGWTEGSLSLSGTVEIGSALDFKRLFKVYGPIALYGQVGAKADVTFSFIDTRRREATGGRYEELPSHLGASIEARLVPHVGAYFASIGSQKLVEFAHAGFQVEGVLNAKKLWAWDFEQKRRIPRIEYSGGFVGSAVVTIGWFSGSFTVFETGNLIRPLSELSGPDPVIASVLVGAMRPTLVTIEQPALGVSPHIVVQEWDGDSWSPGTIVADDGRAKFGLAAAAGGDSLMWVYSATRGLQPDYQEGDVLSLLMDTELYLGRPGEAPRRLTDDADGDIGPSLAMLPDGSAGVLAWTRIDGDADDLASTIMARIWNGTDFGDPVALSVAAGAGEAQATALPDGRLAVAWRDDDGVLHTRVFDGQWTEVQTLPGVTGAFRSLEIGGAIHVIAARFDPETGFETIRLHRLDSAWSEVATLSAAAQSITSIDARPDGEGNLIVSFSSIDGSQHAVHSALLPLGDLTADRWVRTDGGEWAPGDVSVLPAGDNRYHLAYGLFPTAMDQTEPPPAEVRRAPGARLASGVHLIDGTPVRESRVGGLSGAAGSLNIIAINENGTFVYERGSDLGGPGRVINLGVSDAFATESWTQDGRARYAILSTGKVRVWTDGELADLTALLGGDAITEHLTVFTALDGRVFLAGMTQSGELVAYIEQEGQWSYRNISVDDLQPQGLGTPRFSGKVASYVTGWNGLTIAGIDERGDIQGIWWSPGLERWTVSNLSAITGAPRSVGNLAVTLTAWGGINLAATTIDGRLRVTWWVPGFGGNWVVSDLTQNASGVGLQLRPETTFGFTTPWGALNFGGIDQAGELVVFWWAPARESWTPGVLSGPGSQPVSDLRSFVSTTGETSIVGETRDGAVVRHWWAIGSEGWTSEVIPI